MTVMAEKIGLELKRKNMNVLEVERWLRPNLAHSPKATWSEARVTIAADEGSQSARLISDSRDLNWRLSCVGWYLD